MRRTLLLAGVATGIAAATAVTGGGHATAYPAASLEGRQKSCIACHQNSGPWNDESKLLIDIVDAASGKSLKTADGSFEIAVRRGEERRVRTVFGADQSLPWRPECAGWLYVDPRELETAPESSSKFAPGWAVNRAFCGKRLNEDLKEYPGKKGGGLTMTLSPREGAKDATIELQVLFKSMDPTLVGNYYVKRVNLKALE